MENRQLDNMELARVTGGSAAQDLYQQIVNAITLGQKDDAVSMYNMYRSYLVSYMDQVISTLFFDKFGCDIHTA